MRLRLALAVVLTAACSAEATAPARAEVGKLAVIIGTIEAKGPADPEYKPLTQGASVEEGVWIRTAAKSKGIIDYNDGTELRINEKTELLLSSSRHMEFKVGQIFIRMTRGPLFTFKAPHAPIDATVGVFDLYYNPKDADFPVAPGQAITMIHSFEGQATIRSRKYTEHCPVGHLVFMVGGTCNTPERAKDMVLASTWVHEVLLARNPQPPELRQRLDKLVEMLLDAGDTKPAEQALKAAGEAAVPAVVQILKMLDIKDPLNVEPRRKGARILSEVAGLKTAGELKTMLDDKDGEVRVLGAKGLARLAGQDLGFNEKFWKDAPSKAGVDAWDRWIKSKK